MKWIIQLTLIAALACVCSCAKFLDKKVDTGISTPSSLSVLQAMLDNSDIFNIAVTPSYEEASCDNYFIPDESYTKLADNIRSAYQWQPVVYKYTNDWARAYTAVYNANLCLESLARIPATGGDQLQREQIKGAALFHRAYSFLNLVWTFAKAYDKTASVNDLGIDLRLQSDYNIPSKRSSVADTYSRIIADAEEASAYLPDSVGHVFKPGKAAAYGLLARAFLSMSLYDSAYKYASKSLEINNYLIDYNNVTNTSVPFTTWAYAPEVLFYSSMMTGFPFDLIRPSYKYAAIDTALYQQYAAADLRKQLFFNSNGAYYIFKGMYGTSNSRMFSGITTAEMYLIRSECLARAGKVDDCVSELNVLLKSRFKKDSFTPVTAAGKEEAISLVLTERRKELIMRGLRWSDIKRLNKEGENIILSRKINGKLIVLNPNDARYALPLPDDIINLTQMEQN